MAQHLLENGPDFEEKRARNVSKSYSEEQDKLKWAFSRLVTVMMKMAGVCLL